MVNLSTPSEQMLKELLADAEKAEYWLRKHYHGDKGYDRMCQELAERCALTRENQKSDIIEYKSANGNRWLVYAFCRYYGDAGLVRTTVVSFCYYETLGSIGAFFIGYDKFDTEARFPTITIFTSHFFQRFCARLGIEYRSRAMVQRFCEVIPGYLIYPYKERNKEGHIRVDVRLPGSLGRGIMRSEKGAQVFEIRSYLTDKQLTKSQLRETEEVRRLGDKYKYEPLDVWAARLKSMSWDDQMTEIQSMFDQSIERGVDPRLYQVSMVFFVFMANYIYDHNLLDIKDTDKAVALSKRMQDAIAEPLHDYVKNGGDGRPIAAAFGEFMQKEFRNINIGELYQEMSDFFEELNEKSMNKNMNKETN